jgi:hypothetical protein
MRWVNSRGGRSLGLAAALALAACGDYSTEDVRFLSALPVRADLRVEVPAAAAGAGAACGTGLAEVWLVAKPISDGLNAGVDFLIALVDAVRRLPPTDRLPDERRWGPFDDDRHPGREIQVTIARRGEGAEVEHTYRFEGRVKGGGEWIAILTGAFRGPSAEIGRGELALSFDALWALGMNDATTPRGSMLASYDRTSEPRTVELALGEDGFGVGRFSYGFAGYRDGSGWFEYLIRPEARPLDTLTITSAFDSAGAGRAQVSYQTWLGFGGSFRQCWDAFACLVHVDDPSNYSCGTAPCSFGEVASCAPVPMSPF